MSTLNFPTLHSSALWTKLVRHRQPSIFLVAETIDRNDWDRRCFLRLLFGQKETKFRERVKGATLSWFFNGHSGKSRSVLLLNELERSKDAPRDLGFVPTPISFSLGFPLNFPFSRDLRLQKGTSFWFSLEPINVFLGVQFTDLVVA